MNGRVYDQPPSSRGVPDAEASADTGASTNTSEDNSSEQIQVPQSPQSLSLQTDGLNDRAHSKSDSAAYIESSERASGTSDGQRPELQSASTFTDSLPSSSLNDSARSMELDGFRAHKEDAQASNTSKESPAPQYPLPARPVNGDASVEKDYNAVKTEEPDHDYLPPLRSPTRLNSRVGNGTDFTPGHKRTATGDVKSVSSGVAALHSSNTNGTRRRSKSTGAQTHGSRIAQVSPGQYFLRLQTVLTWMSSYRFTSALDYPMLRPRSRSLDSRRMRVLSFHFVDSISCQRGAHRYRIVLSRNRAHRTPLLRSTNPLPHSQIPPAFTHLIIARNPPSHLRASCPQSPSWRLPSTSPRTETRAGAGLTQT